jgi:hypothetical protein
MGVFLTHRDSDVTGLQKTGSTASYFTCQKVDLQIHKSGLGILYLFHRNKRAMLLLIFYVTKNAQYEKEHTDSIGCRCCRRIFAQLL